MTDVFIFDAVRTPRAKGRPGGGLAGVAPMDLIAGLVGALRERLGPEAMEAVQHFALGCVTQVGAQGGHLALAARIRAGLPESASCLTLNAFCVSGMSAVQQAARRIALGEIDWALAGGVESMSQVAFLSDAAPYYSDMGLARAQGWAPVGLAADLMAHREGIGREALDAAALRSHRRAAAAWEEGRFSRVQPAPRPGAEPLRRDENLRDFGDGATLRALPPIFQAVGEQGYDALLAEVLPGLGEIAHTHTLAHCPPISDGAGLVLIGTRAAGARLGLTPVARILSMAETGGDHVLQLTAGFDALDMALGRAGLDLGSVGAVEFMEAFAAVPVKFERDRAPDMDKVNVNGGHLAMGHPMGASGAILIGTLLDAMDHLKAETGVVAATGGVGVGAAMALERA